MYLKIALHSILKQCCLRVAGHVRLFSALNGVIEWLTAFVMDRPSCIDIILWLYLRQSFGRYISIRWFPECQSKKVCLHKHEHHHQQEESNRQRWRRRSLLWKTVTLALRFVAVKVLPFFWWTFLRTSEKSYHPELHWISPSMNSCMRRRRPAASRIFFLYTYIVLICAAHVRITVFITLYDKISVRTLRMCHVEKTVILALHFCSARRWLFSCWSILCRRPHFTSTLEITNGPSRKNQPRNRQRLAFESFYEARVIHWFTGHAVWRTVIKVQRLSDTVSMKWPLYTSAASAGSRHSMDNVMLFNHSLVVSHAFFWSVFWSQQYMSHSQEIEEVTWTHASAASGNVEWTDVLLHNHWTMNVSFLGFRDSLFVDGFWNPQIAYLWCPKQLDCTRQHQQYRNRSTNVMVWNQFCDGRHSYL